jgi:hypothetical protein
LADLSPHGPHPSGPMHETQSEGELASDEALPCSDAAQQRTGVLRRNALCRRPGSPGTLSALSAASSQILPLPDSEAAPFHVQRLPVCTRPRLLCHCQLGTRPNPVARFVRPSLHCRPANSLRFSPPVLNPLLFSSSSLPQLQFRKGRIAVRSSQLGRERGIVGSRHLSRTRLGYRDKGDPAVRPASSDPVDHGQRGTSTTRPRLNPSLFPATD